MKKIESVVVMICFCVIPSLAEGQDKPRFTSDIDHRKSIEKIAELSRSLPMFTLSGGKGKAVIDGTFQAAEPTITAGSNDWDRVYKKVAPAVALIKTENSFGSGFLISKDGWILTNHHVVDGATISDNGSYEVEVEFGQIDVRTGFMKRANTVAPAYVHKWSPSKDLAIIKIDLDRASETMRAFLRHVEPIQFRPANLSLKALEEVALVGNAGAGFLWSIKRGDVSQIAPFASLTDIMMIAELQYETYLELRPELAKLDKKKIEEEIRVRMGGDLGKTLMIESTVPSSEGDSGGPLVDKFGRIVGMCQGIAGEGQPRYYFIHYSEILDFIADIPGEPLLGIWTDYKDLPAIRFEASDDNSDGIPDVYAGFNEEDYPVFLALDLNQNSPWEQYWSKKELDAKKMAADGMIDAEYLLLIDWENLWVYVVFETGKSSFPNFIKLDVDIDDEADAAYETIDGKNYTALDRVASLRLTDAPKGFKYGSNRMYKNNVESLKKVFEMGAKLLNEAE
jgi:hypothetical protein